VDGDVFLELLSQSGFFVVVLGFEERFESGQWIFGINGDGKTRQFNQRVDLLAVFEGVLKLEAVGWKNIFE
jgi:hypothetical protein